MDLVNHEYLNEIEKQNVLIVDDEPELLEIISSELQSAGYNTVACGSAAEALEILGEKPFSLIISDIRMPGMSGLEFYEKILESQIRKPYFIFMTGFADLNQRQALDIGADAFFEKPFAIPELIQLIAHILGPREWNWSRPYEGENLKHEWSFQFPKLEAAERAGDFRLGRAGFFLKIKDSILPREGEHVGFKIEFDDATEVPLEGVGIVRWRESGKTAGCGVEFIHLEEGSRMRVINLIESLKISQLIPLG